MPIMRGMNSKSVDLIYLDPPFNSNVIYRELPGKKDVLSSFTDAWKLRDEDKEWHEGIKKEHRCIYEVIEASEYAYGKSMKAYLCVMTERLFEMHRILKETGSIYLHCDPTASHYLKIVMDCIFGKDNFLNEVVWTYRKWTNTATHFQKNHDVLLLYTAKKGVHKFNKLFDENTPQQEKYKRGWDTNVVERGIRQLIVYDKTKAKKKIESGNYDRIVYRDNQTKVALPDHWNISILNSQAKERTGYPTQKPLALLERIIEASSDKGDLILDPFCGCATAAVAAEKLGRQWVGIDVAYISGYLVKKRLAEEVFVGASLKIKEYEPIFRTDILERTDISDEKVLDSIEIKQRKHKEQEGRCAGCEYPLPLRYLQKDRIVPGTKGGQYTEENIQLLCQPCNSTKGDKDMAYLKAQLKKHDLIYKG